jgi:hypothetical protein
MQPDAAIVLQIMHNRFLPPLFHFIVHYQILQFGCLYCHVYGGGLVIRFIEILQLATTSRDYALTVLYTLQVTIGHTWSSQSITVFTRRCLVSASYG